MGFIIFVISALILFWLMELIVSTLVRFLLKMGQLIKIIFILIVVSFFFGISFDPELLGSFAQLIFENAFKFIELMMEWLYYLTEIQQSA